MNLNRVIIFPLLLGWAGVIVGLFLTPQISLAQTPNASSLQDWQQGKPDDLNNLFNGTGSASSVMNLINRLQSLDGRSSAEISADLQENINSEAAAFRKLQQQQMPLQLVPVSPTPQSAP
jgi:hypothetical protein